ncbi:hypothetical protein ACHWQZ_G018171 [Mnemiopsis leidyi]
MRTTQPTTTLYLGIPLEQIRFDHSTLNITIAIFAFFVGSITVILNTRLCFYYYKKSSLIYEKLFLILSVVDATTGLAALLQSVTFVGILTDQKRFVSVVLTVTYLLSAVSFHVSVFYNVLLAVCRTVILACPFFQFHLKSLYSISILYPILMIMLTIYEVNSVYTNNPDLVGKVMYLLISPLLGSEIIYNHFPDFNNLGYYILLLGLPFVLPSIICLVCCICASIFLRRSSKRDVARVRYKMSCNSAGKNFQNGARKFTNSRATVTILQLSIAFFICNTLYFTTEFTLQALNPDHLPHEMYLVYLAGNFLPFLNSLINPVILIQRGTHLQAYIKKSSKELLTRISCGPNRNFEV